MPILAPELIRPSYKSRDLFSIHACCVLTNRGFSPTCDVVSDLLDAKRRPNLETVLA
jgi:hypothetical protein